MESTNVKVGDIKVQYPSYSEKSNYKYPEYCFWRVGSIKLERNCFSDYYVAELFELKVNYIYRTSGIWQYKNGEPYREKKACVMINENENDHKFGIIEHLCSFTDDRKYKDYNLDEPLYSFIDDRKYKDYNLDHDYITPQTPYDE